MSDALMLLIVLAYWYVPYTEADNLITKFYVEPAIYNHF